VTPATATLPRLCLVTTAAIVVRQFLVPHLRELTELFDVTLVANEDCSALLAHLPRPPRMAVIPIERAIHPVNDAKALLMLTRLLRRERFDVVFSVAPKAGLIGMVAAAAARVPYRTHIFLGQVWATRTGLMRHVLRGADKVIAGAATECLADSASQRDFLISEGIASPARLRILGSGSFNGVDTARFAPDPAARCDVRARLGAGEEDVLVLFLGRLQRDKGILDLVAAWNTLAAKHRDLHLVVAGPDEQELSPVIRSAVPPGLAPRLHIVGETSTPEKWMAAADILSLPSYREGFGNVVIEAASTAIPSVGSRIYGLTDAIVENVTGLLHPPGDSGAIAACLARLINDKALRRTMGAAGRRRVIENFEQKAVVARYASYWAQRSKAVSAP